MKEKLGSKRRMANSKGNNPKINRRKKGTRSNGCRQGTGRRRSEFNYGGFGHIA